MSSLDIIFGVILSVFILVGIWKGFFREVLGFIGIIGGLFLALIGFAPIGKLLNSLIPGIPTFIWPFISFILIFIGVYISSRLLAGILSKLSETIFLGWLNKLLGGLVGGLKGALLISLILMLIGFLPFQKELDSVRNNSMMYEPLQKLIPSAYNFFTGFNVNSNKLENKITNSLKDTEGKLSEEIIKYFFYGKNSADPE